LFVRFVILAKNTFLQSISLQETAGALVGSYLAVQEERPFVGQKQRTKLNNFPEVINVHL